MQMNSKVKFFVEFSFKARGRQEENTYGFVLTNVIIAIIVLCSDEHYHCNWGSELVVVCEIESKGMVCENKSKI